MNQKSEIAAGNEPGETSLGKPVVPTVNWDDSNMKTSYANVVNAASTREEVTLFFGTNQTWKLANKQQEFNVVLSDRIILNPLAARRLWTILGAVLKEYETRFGALSLGGRNTGGGAG